MADIPGDYSNKGVHEKSPSAEKDGQWSTSEQELYDAIYAENAEHQLGVWEAAKKQPMACIWAFVACFTIVMEAYDMFLNGKFVALPAFQKRFGDQLPNGKYSIDTKWQSGLNQAGQCGAFVGLFLAGPITNWIGYRWNLIFGLILMNATIFVSFFADSLELLTVGQALEGVPWGMFVANAPAYASEIVPIPLRGVCTATIQMCWTIGGVIASAIMYSLNQRSDEWAWRLPLALQWIFPLPLLLLIFFAPESPYWLVRRGRRGDALRSLQRLGPESRGNDPEKTLAMIERTVEIETRIRGNPKFIDLVKGVDRRRTIIVCLMFMSQNFSGNLITSQAVFFFEQAGMSANFSFELGLIKSCCAFLSNVGSWYLTAYFRRRTIYLYCTAINVVVLVLLGVCASVPQNHSTSLAQAALVFIGTLVFAGGIGPVSWTIIAETSSIRLRPLTTGVGRAAYYVAEIPLIYVHARLINPTGWNLAGKCGYIWGATALVCWVLAYLFLPEMKHRSYRELDILFERKVPARQFKYTVVDVKDNE